jgi:hypothetical protein
VKHRGTLLDVDLAAVRRKVCEARDSVLERVGGLSMLLSDRAELDKHWDTGGGVTTGNG